MTLLLFVLMLQTSRSNAQVIDTTNYPTTNYDSLFATFDTCLTPGINSISPVYFSDEIRVAIDLKFDIDSSFNSSYKLWRRIDSVTRTLVSSTIEPDSLGYLQYNGLGVGRHYELEATSTCNLSADYRIIAEFDTDLPSDTPTMIPVSEKMLNLIEKWNDSAYSNQNLYTFFSSQNSIHVLEKIHFVQQFIFSGATIDVNLAGPSVKSDLLNLNNYGFGDPTISGDCLCGLFELYAMASPRTGNNLSNGVIQPTTWGIEHSYTQGHNYFASYWSSRIGPAKQIGLDMQHGSDPGSTTHHLIHNETAPSGSTRYTILKIAYLCVDPNFVPDECECGLDYKVTAGYDIRMHAKAQIGTGTILEKKAGVIIEDWSVFYFLNSSASSVETIAAAQVTVKAEDNKTIETEYLLSAAEAASMVASGIANIASGKYLDAVSDVLDAFSTVLTVFGPNPDVSYQEYKEGRGIDPNTNVKMKTIFPGETHTYVLMSFHKIEGWGLRRFYNHASMNSNYALAIAFDDQHPTVDDCCVQEAALWTTGEVGSEALSPFYPGMQKDLKDFYWPMFIGQGTFFKPATQHGTAIGPAIPGCPITVHFSSEDYITPTNAQYSSIKISNGDLVLIKKDYSASDSSISNMEITYDIYDITGRRLASGSYLGYPTIMLPNGGIPRNQVLIVVVNEGILRYSEKYLFAD